MSLVLSTVLRCVRPVNTARLNHSCGPVINCEIQGSNDLSVTLASVTLRDLTGAATALLYKWFATDSV